MKRKNETTIGLSFALKTDLQALRIVEEETYESVIRRLKNEAEKVPALEARIRELEKVE